MRLMADGEQPIDIYVKQKKVPQIWYDDMHASGLTDEEIEVVKKYLGPKNGVADSQEVVMQLSMDPHISGFNMKDANKLRKVIAKKKFDEINALHEYYMESGRKLGTSDALLNYVWDKQFALSFGYSFSTIHTTGYSIIAVQEMNLAYHYPIIYWNTACLSVDSSAINSQDFESLIDEDIINLDDDVEGKKVANKMNYAKMAGALDKFKRICNIELPDINKSRLSFTPNKDTNSILYGLKGISTVTDPVINEIMLNRPFKSLDDFLSKVVKKTVSKDKVINLIKSGAFNQIEGKSTKEILEEYIWKVCEPKNKLTLQNANMLIDLDLFPSSLSYECDVYKLTKELRKRDNRDKDKLWYKVDNLMIPTNKVNTWQKIVRDANEKGYVEKDELLFDDGPHKVINSSKWDTFYENNMNHLRTYIKEHHDELLERLNNRLFSDEFNKYCSGDNRQWELDSMNFYFHEHPLTEVIPYLPVEVDHVHDIVENAQDGEFYIKGKIIPKMKLYTLAGTVIDRDKTKGLVTIQCPDGVVNVKVYKDLYATMTQVIGDTDVDGNKNIEQDSFFEKGVHLLITGIQRGATFIPKVYRNTGRKSIMQIVLDKNGKFKSLEEKMDA